MVLICISLMISDVEHQIGFLKSSFMLFKRDIPKHKDITRMEAKRLETLYCRATPSTVAKWFVVQIAQKIPFFHPVSGFVFNLVFNNF